jgi:prepilin-type N-terminal cleavage/methylation domain-containing protein
MIKFFNLNNGFTLVEIFVVILIISIITGIFFGGLKVLQPSMRLDGVIRNLATDLRYAQQQAVSEQFNYGISFFIDTNEYQILKYITSTTTQEISKKSLAQGISFYEIKDFTNNSVIFNPYGSVAESGSVSLVNSKQEIKIIKVKPSGFIKIE